MNMSGLREFLSGKPLKRTAFPSYNADIRKHGGSAEDQACVSPLQLLSYTACLLLILNISM